MPQKGVPDGHESSKRKRPTRRVERLLPNLQGFALGTAWR
jgi:hypothetical protein